MSDRDAEEEAVRRFGPARELAAEFGGYRVPFRLLLSLASVATLGVGLWLVFVIAVVLPSRDPGHIALWQGVAAAFFAYAALSWAYLLRGPREAWLRYTVLAASLAAIVAGLYGIASMVATASHGGHFEGYIILMGLVIAAHGMAAIMYTVLTTRIAGRMSRADRGR